MIKFPASIQNVIEEFNKLPGIGRKTAERLVYHLMKQPPQELDKLSKSISQLSQTINVCGQCHNFSESNPCYLCGDPRRDQNMLCVVAESHDLAALENTSEYKGLYHVLGGTINALEGVTPDQLRIKELLDKINNTSYREVVLAFNPDLEGETTAIYLKSLLKLYPIKVTRLAKGLPMGSDLEYADEATLANAIKGRTIL